MASRDEDGGTPAGPLAGARARPRLSTPLSSGLGDGALSPETAGATGSRRAAVRAVFSARRRWTAGGGASG